MTPTPFTTAEALRVALAQTITCSALELHEAVGQVVVATAAELPPSFAPGADARSVYDPQTRTTVLLADRIPAGQEAVTLVVEIDRRHGRDKALAIFDDEALRPILDVQNGQSAIAQAGVEKTTKFVPITFEPGNMSAFSGIQTSPRQISRNDAAASLWLMREQARRGNGMLIRNAPGAYSLRAQNTIELVTRDMSNPAQKLRALAHLAVGDDRKSDNIAEAAIAKRSVPQAIFDSPEALRIAKLATKEATDELNATPRNLLDEGNPNHPSYDTIFGYEREAFMARQYARVSKDKEQGESPSPGM